MWQLIVRGARALRYYHQLPATQGYAHDLSAFAEIVKMDVTNNECAGQRRPDGSELLLITYNTQIAALSTETGD